MSLMNQFAPRLLLVSGALLGLTAEGALFEKASDVGPSVGHTAGTFGFYFTPNVDLYVTRLGVFDYSSYSTGSALVEVWKAGDVSPVTSASITFSGSNTSEASFNYTFANVAGSPVLTAGVNYLVVWVDNTGSASQPFADGVHAQVNYPIGDYAPANPAEGILRLNYSYIYDGGTLGSGNPWDKQHVAGWEKSVIAGSPSYMDVNIDVVAVPEPVETGAAVGLLFLGLACIRRARQ